MQLESIKRQQREDAKILAKGILVNFLGGLMKMSRGISYIVITRFFGAATFGTYTLCWSFVDLASKFSICGFEQASIRFVAQKEENGEPQRQILAYAFRCLLFLSFSLTVAGYLSAPWLVEHFFNREVEVISALQLMFFVLPFMSFLYVSLAALKGLKIMKYEALLRGFLEPLIFLLLVVVASLVGVGLYGVIFAHLLSFAVVTAFGFFFLWKHRLFPRSWKVSKVFARKVRAFIWPLPFYDAFTFLLSRMNFFLIGFFLDTSAVAFYAVAHELAVVANKIRQSFDPIFDPIVAELHHSGEKERLQSNYQQTFSWGFTIYLLFVGAMWFLSDPLLLLFGDSFIKAKTTMLTLLFAYVLHGMFSSSESMLIMSGKSFLNLVNTIGLFLFNLLFAFFLIPKWGILGAAYGTCASLILFNIVRLLQVFYLFRRHPFSQENLKILLFFGLAFFVVFLLGKVFPSLQPLWFANLFSFLVLCALLFYFAFQSNVIAAFHSLRKFLRACSESLK